MAHEGERITIILVGPTGHGKSTLANTIIGSGTQNLQDPVFLSYTAGDTTGGDRRVTLEPQVSGALIGVSYVRVIDTPGLFDEGRDINSRWTGILKAVLYGPPQIDAIIVVIDSNELHTGAKCFEKIQESLGDLSYGRFLTCFTKQIDSQKSEPQVIAEFNSHIRGGTLGSLWMFSDQNADLPVRKQKMVDLLGKVEEIRKQNWPQLGKDSFKEQTLKFFKEFVDSRRSEVSCQSLSDSGIIDVDLMLKFLSASQIESVMNTHNEGMRQQEERERAARRRRSQERRRQEEGANTCTLL